MRLFDTHAHYDDPRFDEDRDAVLSALPGEGVAYVTNVGTDLETSRATLALTRRYPHVYGAVGYHPHEAKSLTDEGLDEVIRMLSEPKIVALGEIGLDYYYDLSERDVQREVFARQLEIAKALDVPVIIHEREACKETLDILRASGVRRGVVHCFGGSRETARELLNMGFYLSFTGVITFKNARRAWEVVPYVPADRIMAETDCPYLAPVPMRGKRNWSGYVRYVVAMMAEMRQVSFDEMAETTTRNALQFYNIHE